MLTLYHNPRCSKSRQTLELLKSRDLEPKIIEYLKTPPTTEELDKVLKKLHLEPHDIARTKEKIYTELGLKNKRLSRSQMIEILVSHPILIERPILVTDKQAALGRPPENVLEIL